MKIIESRDEIHETCRRNEDVIEEIEVDPVEKKGAQYKEKCLLLRDGRI
jgi:hypothetical protein